jgi:heme-degrading monooxygenase HmoA
MPIFTIGIWMVKIGREDDFIHAWQEMADRTKEDFPEETATLLRDREQINRFISFGPWESLDQIERWRAYETFQRGVGTIREMLEGFTPYTLDVAAQIR